MSMSYSPTSCNRWLHLPECGSPGVSSCKIEFFLPTVANCLLIWGLLIVGVFLPYSIKSMRVETTIKTAFVIWHNIHKRQIN